MLVPQVLCTCGRLGNTSKATTGWEPGGWRSDLKSQSGPWGLELRSWPLELQPGAKGLGARSSYLALDKQVLGPPSSKVAFALQILL